MESLFTFFFKYRPVVFGEGTVGFSPTTLSLVGIALALVAAALAIRHYLGHPSLAASRHRLPLMALRLATLALLFLCLLRPVLVVKAAVPHQNFLGVLVDDSASMQLADEGGASRGERARAAFGPESGAIAKLLAQRFELRWFRFSSIGQRLRTDRELGFAGTQTRVADALTMAREELGGLPLAGLVVVSDGVDTAGGGLDETILASRAANVPVWTVGVGRDALEKDLQVQRLTLPKRVLRGTSLLVDVTIEHRGYGGQTVPVEAEDEGRLVATADVVLPADDQPVSTRLRLTLDEPGPRTIRFRVKPRPDELVAQNNVRDVFVFVEDRKPKILYVEGEPRFEVRFIRRAIADDKNLQLVVLQRTAENKYLRLAIDDPEELAGGFPKTREELFQYDGVVLGSIEAASFSGDQLRMLADFVDRRGGGLLALGGRRAFSEGGFAGTPVADALPVVLEGAALKGATTKASQAEIPPVMHLTVKPTRAGALHPVMQLGADERASAAKWKDLPPLTAVNRVDKIKAGATALLTAPVEGREQIVFAWQRYGRGKSLALTAQDTWQWQMHASIAVDDLTHETLWRQWLRWLVDAVPSQASVTFAPDTPEPDQPVTVTTDVSDASYVALNTAHVGLRVVAPSGAVEELAAAWTGGRDGEYRTTFVPRERGVYEVVAEATREGAPVTKTVAHLPVEPSASEFFDPSMNRGLLERVATETGGRFHRLDEARALADDIKYTSRGVTTVEEHELWDMPIMLAALLALLGGEWVYRRKVGLA